MTDNEKIILQINLNAHSLISIKMKNNAIVNDRKFQKKESTANSTQQHHQFSVSLTAQRNNHILIKEIIS